MDILGSVHTVLGWQVTDIGAAVRAHKAKGVAFKIYDLFGQDDLGVWTAPDSGAKVAWFCDPDGNVLSLTEFSGGLSTTFRQHTRCNSQGRVKGAECHCYQHSRV
jgi:hypothetical protein